MSEHEPKPVPSAGANPWTEKEVPSGMRLVELDSWKQFGDFLHTAFPDTRPYIWRGQRDSTWTLQSSFDRLMVKIGKHALANDDRLRHHLQHFKDAMLGRRGSNPQDLKGDDEVWALGQHYGLATPLLDWTRSPFVAAYFAFWESTPSATGRRAIFALHQGMMLKTEQSAAPSQPDRLPVKIFRPKSDENARLINQAGLFTRTPVNYDVEACIRKNFKGTSTAKVYYKISLPDSDRETVLIALNRMNINHATLFPELYGAAKYTNAHTEIEKYGSYQPE